MDEEQEVKDQTPLIYIALKNEKLYWKNEDEKQEFVDAGYDGLIKGIRSYDITKGIKKSTYYYRCIKYEMFHVIAKKQRKKRTAKVVSLNYEINDEELQDFIPSATNLEEDIIQKEKNEQLLDLVNTLPIAKDRYVIKMMFGLDGFEQLSASEIARRWGVNKNAIIQRKNRALRILNYKIRNSGL